ncbi:MAG: cysteine-rich CWC family protein [Kiritimatiellae bacterium]|nr:cysteine-rich CWC family protein [Kiritimatiellia bacterium]MDW8457706.1 cysteine-rich CWC family protein [Verrucomicrobiota bacterium]
MSSDVDPARCPLCGGPNHCAMANGFPVTSCWCAEEYIPPALLARVPARAYGRACICRACLASHTNLEGQSLHRFSPACGGSASGVPGSA